MNPELAVAKCKFEELKSKVFELNMAIDDARAQQRMVTAPLVANREIDTTRLLYLDAQLVKLVHDLREAEAQMARLQQEYNL